MTSKTQRPTRFKRWHIAAGMVAASAAIAVASAALLQEPEAPSSDGGYHIGVYYYPGWKDNDPGNVYPHPWQRIMAYPEREPLLGWYKEGDPAILDQQLRWMHEAGFSYVVFSQNFGRNAETQLDHVVNAYKSLPDHHGVKYAIQWSNNYKLPENPDQFYNMVRYWTSTYMHDPDYMRVDGKPLLFVFTSWQLTQNVQKFGSVASLFGQAQKIAQAAGLPGISFVAGQTVKPQDVAWEKGEGYGAIASYGYNNATGATTPSHSYKQLDGGYRSDWAQISTAVSPMLFILPMSRGFDKRPLGGSADPKHDLSRGSASAFETHLLAGRAFINAHRDQTRGYGIVCCWNEFGEGSFIEPSAGEKFASLDAVSKVFGSGQPVK